MNKISEGKITMLGFDNWFVIQNITPLVWDAKTECYEAI